jgi:uracil-DNA glycosylase
VVPPRDAQDLEGLVHPEWLPVLAPVAADIAAARAHVRERRDQGHTCLPGDQDLLRAFRAPFGGVRVLVVGQDPYPTPGHAMGLAFSVPGGTRPLPRSLRNVFRELSADLGVPEPREGDLTPWADAGVLLLNRVLSVEAGASGSHRRLGWERVTDRAVAALAERGGPLVAILWGREAQALRPLLGDVPVVESVHPSPLSASRGFFGSRPFSRANELLLAQGGVPVDWSLDRDGS